MKITLLCLLLFTSVISVFANDKKNNVSFAFEIASYHYEEPGIMELNGVKYGVNAELFPRNFLSKSNDRFFCTLQTRFMIGTVGYDGSYKDSKTKQSTPVKIPNIVDLYVEPRCLLGCVYYTSDVFEILHYMGIGCRYLLNKLSCDSDRGYDRESMYLYLPLGADFKFKCKKEFNIILNAEYDLFCFGLQKSYMRVSPLKNDQDSGYGFRFSVKVFKKYRNTVLSAGPFLRCWSIEKSSIVEDVKVKGKSWNEPKNHTVEIGFQLGVQL
jgi:hypothetical protein